MNLAKAIVVPHAPPAKAAGSQVWDRLWKHPHSREKDDALLDRERRGARFASIVRHLRDSIGDVKSLRTIELGCGRGDLSALLAELGAEVTLVDASEEALRQADDRFSRLGLKSALHQCDLFSLPEALSARFDVAISSGVIEHFMGEDRTRAIAAHRDALHDSGLAVISVPHAYCPPYRVWKAYLELRGWWPYGLEIPYSAGEIIRRAHRAGFRRAETECFDFRKEVIRPAGSHRSTGSRRQTWLDRRFGRSLVLWAWNGLWHESS